MSKRIVIVVNSCNDCQHQDHSGAFTPGGARLICGHQKACNAATRDGRRSGSIRGDDRYHWKHRQVGDGTVIPEWCPL